MRSSGLRFDALTPSSLSDRLSFDPQQALLVSETSHRYQDPVLVEAHENGGGN